MPRPFPAAFENADRRLWPGQFVSVTLTLATDPRAIVVPTAAVQAGQQGSYVFVVKADREYNLVAENRLETDSKSSLPGFMASPAIVDDELFLRSTAHMYCISGKK